MKPIITKKCEKKSCNADNYNTSWVEKKKVKPIPNKKSCRTILVCFLFPQKQSNGVESHDAPFQSN